MATSFLQKLKQLLSNKNLGNDDFFDDLTDTLIEGDLSAKSAYEFVEQLEKASSKSDTLEESLQKLKDILSPYVLETDLMPKENATNIYLILGVNGVGKTTSIAKMAVLYKSMFEQLEKGGKKNELVIAAADTFRAAAIDQIKFHGEKVGVRVVAHKDGADPSAVVFDAAESVNAKGSGLVLVDTAGRLHNKENLVRELQKIDRTAKSKATENCYKKILVLDATTGQNAFRQAEVFNEAVGIDAVVLTKYDSSAKGGVVVTLGKELQLPIAYICNGESYQNISVFSKEKFLDEFLGINND